MISGFELYRYKEELSRARCLHIAVLKACEDGR